MSSMDFNFASKMLWDAAWESTDPTSGHNHWSALTAAGRQCQKNSIRGDGNCGPRALAEQIVKNDPRLLVSENVSLGAYAVPHNVPRTHQGLRALFVEWLLANEPYFNHRGALQYCVMPHGIATSLRAYAASAAVDGFWLGTLFFHWAAGLLRSDTPACTKCRGCAHKQVACDSVKLPVYNYLLYDSEVARGHTRTLGNLRLVEPFVTAPPHILH